ncbi:MAG: endolytic transglycosylase MltG [Bacteroidetes bacterium]|jgi:UPF0755 protein|nr:endolytic transglycosylase MltG [Bacteroidota bacterium]
MKKLFYLVLLFLFVYTCYNLLIKTTHFVGEKTSFVYHKTGLSDLADTLVAKKIIFDKPSFLAFAKILKVEDKLKPGKFLVLKNTSLLSLLRMLRNNQQLKIKFVLNKVRTRAELAKLIATSFDKDSADCALYLNSNDSLAKFQTDTTQLFTLFIPNTYEFYWSTSMTKFIQKMKAASDEYWSSNNRIQKAKSIGLSKNEVYTLASIVEEETNYDSDKTIIASVYQNRLKKNMPLQACPTIKYAMQDFTLTRIYDKYLSNPSLYNTYRHKGLPPGPIGTPAPKTIDLVLDAPNTAFIYFVAKADFSGYHHFSSDYTEHMKYAKAYQLKLDEYQAKKQQKAP